jgi:hypothetical protein
MDFPFEGIPTVPPRKDMDHLVSWGLAEEAVLMQCALQVEVQRARPPG